MSILPVVTYEGAIPVKVVCTYMSILPVLTYEGASCFLIRTSIYGFVVITLLKALLIKINLLSIDLHLLSFHTLLA